MEFLINLFRHKPQTKGVVMTPEQHTKANKLQQQINNLKPFDDQDKCSYIIFSKFGHDLEKEERAEIGKFIHWKVQAKLEKLRKEYEQL